MTKKIFWTAQEWDLILPIAEVEFQANRGERHWADCLDSAQMKRHSEGILGDDRIRPLDSLRSYVRDRIIEQRNRGKELLTLQSEAKQLERDAIHVEPLKIPPPPVALASKIKELLKTPCDDFEQRLESIIDDSVNHLIGLFETRLQAKLNMSILSTIGNLAEIADGLKLKDTKQPTSNKPKLGVLGVMTKHLPDFTKDFSDYFQIEFIDFRNVGQMSAKLKNKDYVAVNSAYFSHTAFDIVKKSHPNNIIIAAGYNQLSDAILEFILNSKELAG